MRIIPSAVQRLLVKLPADVPAGPLLTAGTASGSLFRLSDAIGPEHIAAVRGIGHASLDYHWQRVVPLGPAADMHPWDAAHQLARRARADTQREVYAEPDYQQQPPLQDRRLSVEMLDGDVCHASGFDPDWGPTGGLTFGWHLGKDFSGLKAARDAVGDRLSKNGKRVRIGHLDTGYDPNHISRPMRLHPEMGWNFVENNANAVAPTSAGGLFADPSHGTGTLGLLAGKQIPQMSGDFLGGAPYADIVPVRIANTWLHLWTSSLSGGIHHAVGWGCDIISLSAGGLPAQSWADEVNAAYEAGCCIFAASGDSKGAIPTRFTVYPARFKRVVSVCGVTHEGQPYFNDAYDLSARLEGNWGPDSAMKTAVSAYAPNVPWAKQGCAHVFDNDGSGTSASTPQAAAAGALWLQMHWDELADAQPWQRVEAIRYALFTSALAGNFSKLGNGKLRAMEALQVGYDPSKLTKAGRDDISFALLKVLFGVPLNLAAADLAEGKTLSSGQQLMLEVEATQLVLSSPQLSRIVGDADLETDPLTPAVGKKLIQAMRSSPEASRTLRSFLNAAGGKL